MPKFGGSFPGRVVSVIIVALLPCLLTTCARIDLLPHFTGTGRTQSEPKLISDMQVWTPAGSWPRNRTHDLLKIHWDRGFGSFDPDLAKSTAIANLPGVDYYGSDPISQDFL